MCITRTFYQGNTRICNLYKNGHKSPYKSFKIYIKKLFYYKTNVNKLLYLIEEIFKYHILTYKYILNI